MTGFKNKFFTFVLCLFAFDATAQDEVYRIPSVQLLPLKKMETNSVGLTVAGSDDFLNESAWKNAAYPSIEKKLKKIPDILPAKAEELRLNLLKLSADAPQNTEDDAFITLRLRELYSRGQPEDVYALIRKIPEKKRTEEQNRIYADVLLAKNLPEACPLTDQITDTPFSQELAAVCAALNQDSDKAFLALELLNERKDADPFISNAAEHFLFRKPLTENPVKKTPLTVAVWRQSGRNVTDLITSDDPVWFKALVVRDETVPADDRLKFAEELVQEGLLPPSELRDLYQKVSFKEDKKTPSTEVLNRARTVQQAVKLSNSVQDNLQKQTLLRQGLASAKKDRISYAFSAAVKDILETLKPDADTLEHSADMIKAFTLAGLHEQAEDWHKKAEILFPASETAVYGWYYAELSRQDKSGHLFLPEVKTMRSFEGKNKRAYKKAAAKADRLMLVFDLLKMVQPDEKWKFTTFIKGSVEDGFARRKTASPVQNRSAGENVLDALQKMNGTYAGLLRALSVLTRVGMEREAKAIAAQSMGLILDPAAPNE